MAHKLVRCLEGHVYDSTAHKKCPVCGSDPAQRADPAARKSDPPQAASLLNAIGAVKGLSGLSGKGITSLKDAASLQAIGKLDKRVLIGGGAGLVLLLVIGAWAGGLFDGDRSRGQREFQQATDKKESSPDSKTDTRKDADTGKKSETKTSQTGTITDCDRYAMSPADPDRIAGVTGVLNIGEINAAVAIPACEKATQDFPNERRLWAELGRAYRAGKNNARAADAYRQAMDKGSAYGAYALATMMRDGIGMQPNPAEARSLLRKAADAGVPAAMVDYASMAGAGFGGQQDSREAERWLQRAVEEKYLPAYNQLGTLYLEGKLGPANAGKARELFEFAAKQKDPDGIANVGYLYETGNGVKKDPAAARAQYLQAADAGSTWAMRRMARMLISGMLAPRESGEAQRWLMQAANSGDTEAMLDLGYGYKNGAFGGGVADYSASRQWFERAAEAGNAGAMNEMGMAYHGAQGVPRDYDLARSWYERAAQMGNRDAIANLGVLYEFGYGVPQNYSKAWQLFEDAAERGNGFAMFHLGQMTQYGKGLQPDLQQAAQWYAKAGEAGSADGNWRAMMLFDRYSDSKNLGFLADLALKAAKGGSQEALHVLFREPGRISQETRAAIEQELESKGFLAGPARGRFDRKSREALEAYLRSGR